MYHNAKYLNDCSLFKTLLPFIACIKCGKTLNDNHLKGYKFQFKLSINKHHLGLHVKCITISTIEFFKKVLFIYAVK